MCKFKDEPWKTINLIQDDLRSVDVENKSMHKYLSQLQLEAQFNQEIILSSGVVQRLLKQGLSLLKHSESLRNTIVTLKNEAKKASLEYSEEIKNLVQKNFELQNQFKAKINEINDKHIILLTEKENLEKMYIEAKMAADELSEITQNAKEYQKTVEDSIKEKEILRRDYNQVQAQLIE